MVTATQLAQICRAAPQKLIDLYCDRLNRAMDEFGINTWKRQAAFLAQIAHESGELRYVRELATGAAYDTGSLARRLGNTPERDGDGQRYKGRGLIQITGRDNYRECSNALFPADPDLLIRKPEFLEQPTQACRSAAWFWHSRGLNRWADIGAFQTITKRINGGLNGYDERVRYWKRAIAVLGPKANPSPGDD